MDYLQSLPFSIGKDMTLFEHEHAFQFSIFQQAFRRVSTTFRFLSSASNFLVQHNAYQA